MKPTPPEAPAGAPSSDANSPPSSVAEWMANHAAPLPAAPEYNGGPAPLAAPAPLYDAQEYLDSAERALPLTDERVLCNACVHGWIMAEVAPTKNLKPDGTEFHRYKGFCTFGGRTMSLQDMRPTLCNRYQPAAAPASPEEAP